MDIKDITRLLEITQGTRFLTLDTDTADDLFIERFHAREAVNEDFEFALDCVSPSAFIELPPLLAQPATVGIACADGTRRYWHGYITHAAALGADGGLARYRLTLRSGLAFLETRRNTLIFQGKTALEIIEQVFDDYSQVAWRDDTQVELRRRPICTQYRETDRAFVTRLLGEEGLSYWFEHDPTTTTGDSPGHTVVISDNERSQSLPAGTPETVRFHRVHATEAEDAVTVFTERRELAPNAVATASWAPAQVQSVAGEARAPAGGSGPDLPSLDQFHGDRMGRFETSAQAQRYATHRLDAARLLAHHFNGQGALRTLTAARTYTLVAHPTLAGQAFVPLSVDHHATNNLGTDIAHLLGADDAEALGEGSYRQQFRAVPAGTPLSPTHTDKPLAPGCDTAIVVGVPDDTLTGTRDHQVRVQFYWQRGEQPLPGGQTETHSRANPKGHAPGDERSGTWVRVTEAAAGANHGHSFVPRIGTEVLIEYAHGDIDQPVIVGQLYNGKAEPPFAAGEDSHANHPGTLSGVRTQTLDGDPSATWVLDDASGQLRHSLHHHIADSGLSLGYLIEQEGATRGAFRGEGFELASAGWASVRAGEGLLVSATARTREQSTQLDTAEARGQLAAAHATAERLTHAATDAGTVGLNANDAAPTLTERIDPAKDGHYAGRVGGADPTRPANGQRHGGDPVERFATPAVVMETPANQAWTTPNSAAFFAGDHQHVTSQENAHLAAGATVAAAAGEATSLYTADGGINAIADGGPVSVEAHTDTLHVEADDSLSITSDNDRIAVQADDTITLRAGQCTITLDGPDITLACPGKFTVKSAQDTWAGGANQAASITPLPEGTVTTPDDVEIPVDEPDDAYNPSD